MIELSLHCLCSLIPSSPLAVFKLWPILSLHWDSAIFNWDLEFRYLLILADSFEIWIIWGMVSGKGAWRLKLASLLKALFTDPARKLGAQMWVRVAWKEILTVLLHTSPVCLSPYSPAVALFYHGYEKLLFYFFFLKYLSYSDYSIYILDNQSHFHQALGITDFFTGVKSTWIQTSVFRRQKHLVTC